MPVSFHYQIPSFRIKNKKKITDWILLIAFLEKKEIEKVDFVFCDDEYLLLLNKHFLSHVTLTDIITFDYSEKKIITAEIYISVERVNENKTNFKVSFEEELHRVMIHGVLHCLGYGDKSEAEKKIMRREETKCLKLLNEI
jgi:probable rRNA maturation factor